MIDPISAFAAANAAVKGIKQAIKFGQDVSEIGDKLQDFFEHRDSVQKAAQEEKSKNKNKNINSQAMRNVMNARKLRQAEKDLKERLIWSGNSDLYEEILRERIRLKREAEKAKELAAYKKQKVIEWTMWGGLLGALIGVTIWIIYKLTKAIISMG